MMIIRWHIEKIARGVAALLLLAAAVMIAFGFNASRAHPDEIDKIPELPVADNLEPDIPSAKLSPEAWSVFRRDADSTPGGERSDARFRLAGTFFLLNPENETGNEERGAILDDIDANQQFVVREGQVFRDYDVTRIFNERVILRRDGEELELTLSFKGSTGGGDHQPVKTADATVDLEDYEEPLETNRFGARVGNNRWVISKQALFDYYDELMDHPERIEPVYRALAPERDDEGNITGYRYNKEGEDVLYEAAGILEGDIVRRVNSMNMISQKRAEYFIGEFIQGRMGAVVLDIERNGVEEKLIYLLR